VDRVARECGAQVAGEFGAIDDLLPQHLVEHDHAIAAGFFGRVHRDVGVAQQAVDGFVQRIDGNDADACGNRCSTPSSRIGSLNASQMPSPTVSACVESGS